MSLEDRAKAAAKNVEGKVQEAVGNLTGDQGAQIEGQAKQAEAAARHAAEDAKEAIKDTLK